MTVNIVPFDFEGSEVRVIGTADDPAWVAVDICRVLGIGNVSQAMTRLDDDEKTLILSDTLSDNPDGVWVVTESGLYSLVLRSRKPHAKRFRKWVTSEVLPSIRKTGSYSVPTQAKLPPADIRTANFFAALKGFGIEIDNPRYAQSIKDVVLDQIIGAAPALAPSQDVWLGVVEKAERMGYPVGIVAKCRGSLGKFVASHGLTATKEKRLCNGTMRDINLYLDCPELEAAIAEFLDAKILTTAG